MSRAGVDYIQDYFLPSFTYGLGMITPYPDMANSVGCPAGTHVSTLGCSPRKSEGDTQTTHRRTKSKRSPPQFALRLPAVFYPFGRAPPGLMTQPYSVSEPAFGLLLLSDLAVRHLPRPLAGFTFGRPVTLPVYDWVTDNLSFTPLIVSTVPACPFRGSSLGLTLWDASQDLGRSPLVVFSPPRRSYSGRRWYNLVPANAGKVPFTADAVTRG